jgi:hypothetical protein
VDDVRDDLVLRPQPMPALDTWATAVERAGVLFGENLDPRVVSPRSLARFARISGRVDQLRAPAADLVPVLESNLPRLGAPVDAPRLRTAETAVRVLDALRRAQAPAELVAALAEEPIDVPLATLSRSLSSAAQMAQTLRTAEWQVFERLGSLRGPDADAVRAALRTGAATNEDAAPLAKVIGDARRRILDLIVVPPPPPPPPPDPDPDPQPDPPPDTTMQGTRDEVLSRLRETLPAAGRVEITVRVLADGDH